MPISVGRAVVNQALNIMHEDDLVYFDFRCTRCKKNNRVSKEQLQHASPNWEYEPTAKPAVKKEKPAEEPAADKAKAAESKTAPAKKTLGYLRVSTADQDLNKNKADILHLANVNDLDYA